MLTDFESLLIKALDAPSYKGKVAVHLHPKGDDNQLFGSEVTIRMFDVELISPIGTIIVPRSEIRKIVIE